MKISEKDIVSTVRELRDEENQQLHVSPWNRRRRFHFPTWLAAVPAAAVIGFLFGVWTNSHTTSDQRLAALADTVYITIHDTLHQQASADAAVRPYYPQSDKRIHRRQTRKPTPTVTTGQPMANDNIRYDLLVKN